MIVADANVVAALYFEGVDTEDARRLLECDGDWLVPELWQHEMLNIAASYAKFTQTSLARVAVVWEHAAAQFGSRMRPVNMMETLRLAAKSGISAYDAQYVFLAQELGVWLVTQDKKLRAAVPDRALSLREALADLS